MRIAAERQTKSWELRAAISLANLLISRGRREEARGIVKPVYDWFTEGLETGDLREARAMLDALDSTAAHS